MNRYFIMFVLLTTLLQGCGMASRDLLDEILALPEPERFKPTDVSSIVTKHIPLGTEKSSAIDHLRANGFSIREVKESIPQCPDCDELTAWAGYTKKNNLPFLPYESVISIQLGFKQGRVAFVSGQHSENLY